MRNIALRLRYDGSRYHGWQVQKKDSTVAQTMEDALEKVLGVRTKITGCGRTDAGVQEQNLWPFLTLCMGVLSENPLFVLINSYTTGLSPSVLTYMTESTVSRKFGGHSDAQELGLPVSSNGLVLPCGASCRWTIK